jgi:hypothetical protein
MPLLNPFRRAQPDRPSLRQNASSVAARLARVIRKPAAAPPISQADETPATLDFTAYNLPDPIKTPHQWAARFAEFAMGMHVADRILRMSKTKAMAFIRDAGDVAQAVVWQGRCKLLQPKIPTPRATTLPAPSWRGCPTS